MLSNIEIIAKSFQSLVLSLNPLEQFVCSRFYIRPLTHVRQYYCGDCIFVKVAANTIYALIHFYHCVYRIVWIHFLSHIHTAQLLIITIFFSCCFLWIFLFFISKKKVMPKFPQENNTTNIVVVFLTFIVSLIANVIVSNTNLKRKEHFSVILFLFFFILTLNFTGLVPFSYTWTSAFSATIYLALMHFIGINILGVFKNKWKILNLFLPSGSPIIIAPFLIIIETISYLAKVLSLSIRLFANMMSGHALLKILIGFAWLMLSNINYDSTTFELTACFIIWILVTIIFCLEVLIAFLQAYVFTVLITIYITDVTTNFH